MKLFGFLRSSSSSSSKENRRKPSCCCCRKATGFSRKKELEEAFMMLGASSANGHISIGDLRSLMASLLKKEDKEVALMMEEADKDGDGLLSLEDLRGLLVSEEEEEWFKAVDRNNDGMISSEELQEVMVQSVGIKSCTVEECRLIISAHDQDGDGLLNFQEFQTLFLPNFNNEPRHQLCRA